MMIFSLFLKFQSKNTTSIHSLKKDEMFGSTWIHQIVFQVKEPSMQLFKAVKNDLTANELLWHDFQVYLVFSIFLKLFLGALRRMLLCVQSVLVCPI